MTQDELRKPLRPRGDKTQAGKTPGRRRRVDGMTIFAATAGAAVLAAGAWAAFVHDPLGGEPIATASIDRRAPVRPAGEAPAHDTAPQKAGSEHMSRDGVPIVHPGDPMPKSGPVIIRVPGADAPSPRPLAQNSGEVDVAMLEDSRFGPLPRIATDGRRPSDAYALKVAPPAEQQARVALMIAGLGVGRDATLAAIAAAPREVSLAFSPYGSDVAELMDKARQDGHETLIQAPMEPFAYPSNDPGPQTLLIGLPASANLERLRWTLGRAKGYVGVAPLAGSRFLQTDEALSPVFTELARRGLMFVGQSDRESRFGALADKAALPHLQASQPIDAIADAGAIDAALADLEREAKAGGAAVGWASASPLTLKRIEAWRQGLGARGVTLVPVTAALQPKGPS